MLLGTAVILVIVGVPMATLAVLFIPMILAGHTGDDAWMLLYLLLIPFFGYLIAAPTHDERD